MTSTFSLPNSSRTIPKLGFGVYLSTTCRESTLNAIKAGYRHIDTAQYYDNEKDVGEGIRNSNVKRSEIFVTSKILSPGNDVDSTYKKIVDSVVKIDGEQGYVDLFLIHSPNGGAESRKLMWLALERAKADGKVREIGVSNYGIQHIKEIQQIGKVWPPAVNQIELHPWCQQREIVKYCESENIVVEAYSPLVRNQKATDKTLLDIAQKHSKSTGQVLIRYSLQKNWVPLPKSDNPKRIKENADVYGFELDSRDMEALDALDQGERGAIVQAVKNS